MLKYLPAILMITLVLCLLFSCNPSREVNKVQFSKKLDPTKDWISPCIYRAKSKQLTCVEVDELFDAASKGQNLELNK